MWTVPEDFAREKLQRTCRLMGPFLGKTPYLTIVLLLSFFILRRASSTIEETPTHIAASAGNLDNTCVGQLPPPPQQQREQRQQQEKEQQQQKRERRERGEEEEGGGKENKVRPPGAGMGEVVEKRMAEVVIDKKRETAAEVPAGPAADVTAPASVAGLEDDNEDEGYIPARYVVGCGGDRVEAGRRCACRRGAVWTSTVERPNQRFKSLHCIPFGFSSGTYWCCTFSAQHLVNLSLFLSLSSLLYHLFSLYAWHCSLPACSTIYYCSTAVQSRLQTLYRCQGGSASSDQNSSASPMYGTVSHKDRPRCSQQTPRLVPLANSPLASTSTLRFSTPVGQAQVEPSFLFHELGRRRFAACLAGKGVPCRDLQSTAACISCDSTLYHRCTTSIASAPKLCLPPSVRSTILYETTRDPRCGATSYR